MIELSKENLEQVKYHLQLGDKQVKEFEEYFNKQAKAFSDAYYEGYDDDDAFHVDSGLSWDDAPEWESCLKNWVRNKSSIEEAMYFKNKVQGRLSCFLEEFDKKEADRIKAYNELHIYKPKQN